MATTSLKDKVRRAAGKPVEAAPAVDDTDSDPSRELTHDEQANRLFRWSPKFAEALPACVELPAFEAAIRNLVPTLSRCRTSSVLQSLLSCAAFGLVPDGRQAAIVADGDRAVFIPMYQGYIELMHRSGHVESVRVGMIYEGDDFDWEPSAPPPLDFRHKPRPELRAAERGEPILAYAFCWLRGGARSQVVVVSLEEAEEVRDYHSRAYLRAEESGARDSAWHTSFRAMWQKTPIRRLAKLVPMSAEVRTLAAVEDAGDAGDVQILIAQDLLPQAAPEAAPKESAGERAVQAQRRRAARSKGKRQRGGPKAAAA